MRIENKMQREKTAIPVKCVKRRHIQPCLDALNFKGIFQDSQGDQIVHPRKFVSNVWAQFTVTSYTRACGIINNTFAT